MVFRLGINPIKVDDMPNRPEPEIAKPGGSAPSAASSLAVALSVDPLDPSIPTIVASGQGAVAREIVDLAFAHGVKVRQDQDLVQILSTLKVGDAIPVVSFVAVAEILAHIYRWDLQDRADTPSSSPVGP